MSHGLSRRIGSVRAATRAAAQLVVVRGETAGGQAERPPDGRRGCCAQPGLGQRCSEADEGHAQEARHLDWPPRTTPTSSPFASGSCVSRHTHSPSGSWLQPQRGDSAAARAAAASRASRTRSAAAPTAAAAVSTTMTMMTKRSCCRSDAEGGATRPAAARVLSTAPGAGMAVKSERCVAATSVVLPATQPAPANACAGTSHQQPCAFSWRHSAQAAPKKTRSVRVSPAPHPTLGSPRLLSGLSDTRTLGSAPQRSTKLRQPAADGPVGSHANTRPSVATSAAASHASGAGAVLGAAATPAVLYACATSSQNEARATWPAASGSGGSVSVTGAARPDTGSGANVLAFSSDSDTTPGVGAFGLVACGSNDVATSTALMVPPLMPSSAAAGTVAATSVPGSESCTPLMSAPLPQLATLTLSAAEETAREVHGDGAAGGATMRTATPGAVAAVRAACSGAPSSTLVRRVPPGGPACVVASATPIAEEATAASVAPGGRPVRAHDAASAASSAASSDCSVAMPAAPEGGCVVMATLSTPSAGSKVSATCEAFTAAPDCAVTSAATAAASAARPSEPSADAGGAAASAATSSVRSAETTAPASTAVVHADTGAAAQSAASAACTAASTALAVLALKNAAPGNDTMTTSAVAAELPVCAGASGAGGADGAGGGGCTTSTGVLLNRTASLNVL
jgi:hypothetical protein